MSIYSVKGKGWRYDFTHQGTRHTEAWFTTKKAAKEAEARKRQELKNPPPVEVETSGAEKTSTDMAFLDLVNRWLDHLQAYRSERHYKDSSYHCRRWIKRWGKLACNQITREMVERFMLERSRISAQLANKEIRYLRGMFNFGIKRRVVSESPPEGIDFLPVEKKIRYIPPVEDVTKVLAAADRNPRDYLWTIWETMGRMSEINRLTWDDVNLDHTGLTDCIGCHAGDAPADHYVGQCSDCHNTTAWSEVEFNHDGYTDCISCHEADRPDNHPHAQCSQCHNTTSWSDVANATISNEAIIVLDGVLKVSCETCHPPVSITALQD